MLTFTDIAVAIKKELVSSKLLGMIPQDSIVIIQSSDALYSIPSFDKFLIVIRPSEDGFISIAPRINRIIRYTYSINIDIYEKRSADELNYLEFSKYDILKYVIEILEHNTLNNLVVTYPDTAVSNIAIISTDTEGVDGISFVWQAYKDMYKN